MQSRSHMKALLKKITGNDRIPHYDEFDPATGQERGLRSATYPADSVTNISVTQWRNVTDTIAPTAPSNLKISSIFPSNFSLSWQAATDNIGVIAYEVYKDGILYGTTTVLGLKIGSLTNCETKLTVKAKDTAGNLSVSSLPVFVNQLKANAGADKTGICGSSVQLTSAATVYGGTGLLRYKWTPATGLNNDTIPSPTATITGERTYVMAITTANGCIGSDTVALHIIPMTKPDIGIVGISSSNKNRVVWNKPVSTGIASYIVYRETNVTDVYEKIGSTSYDSLSVFVDNQSAADIKSNKYKLSIFDKNGLESAQSNAHKTMHLTINKGQNNTWNLIWEPYEGFTVSTYNIYRGTNLNNLNFIDATSASSSQYSDISAPTGDVYYQMEVISPTLVNPTKTPATIQKSKDSETSTLASYSSSRSNIATNVISAINELEETKINIYPNPVKNEFRIDFEGGSTFEILNLMGQVVYNGNLNMSHVVSTTHLNLGVYLIRIKTGTSFEYRKIIKE
jgi:Secretion system C-terminal sorting domain